MPLCGQENRWGQRNRRIWLSNADMNGLVTKRVEYSRPEVCFGGDSGLLNPKVAQKCAPTTDTVVHTSRANGQCLVLAGPTCAQCVSAVARFSESPYVELNK